MIRRRTRPRTGASRSRWCRTSTTCPRSTRRSRKTRKAAAPPPRRRSARRSGLDGLEGRDGDAFQVLDLVRPAWVVLALEVEGARGAAVVRQDEAVLLERAQELLRDRSEAAD